MARLAAFSPDVFLASAAALIAEGGPDAATAAAIAGRVGAPTGSLYYRFSSLDMLLGELWLGLAEGFQRGFLEHLAAGDGLAAALYTPRWVRKDPQGARVLLLHRREDFIEKKWPARFAARSRRLGAELAGGIGRFARTVFGTPKPEEMRRLQFALVHVPLAAVRPHLMKNEAVPSDADELVRETYMALMEKGARPRGEEREA